VNSVIVCGQNFSFFNVQTRGTHCHLAGLRNYTH